MLRSQRIRSGVARLLLGLHIAVLVNGVVFRHAHRLSDGTIICHAHPYSGTPNTQFPSHTHSTNELIWLDAFTNALYTNAAPEPWVPLLLVTLCLLTYVIVQQRLVLSFPHVAFRHRGPPALLA